MSPLHAASSAAQLGQTGIIIVKAYTPWCQPCSWVDSSLLALTKVWQKTPLAIYSIDVNNREPHPCYPENRALVFSWLEQAKALPGQQDTAASWPKFFIFKDGVLRAVTDGVDWRAVKLPEDRSNVQELSHAIEPHMVPYLHRLLDSL